MWAGGNYFSNPIPIKGFDIYHCLHLENIFIARSFCRIASTAFLRTQHGEIYIGLIEQAYKGLGNSLCPIVETSGTTNPKKNFWSFALGCVLSHSWYNYFFLEIIHYYAVSVSYTHLRAHETDSYLVCRLLLEKKKRK